MDQNIVELKNKAIKEIEESKNQDDLRALEVKYLGRKGELANLFKKMPTLSPSEKPLFGKLINEVKTEIENSINNKKNIFEFSLYKEIEEKEWFDFTVPRYQNNAIGHIHPITQLQYELEEIFEDMGFYVLDGPEIETEANNFEALNIPKHHPARDLQDTFWLEDENLLRTHTSCVQIRALKSIKPPFGAIAPGRVFRYEATDASHENTFYQIEGLFVDRKVSVANLIYTMDIFIKHILGEDIKIRLRPGYFPFVEPGFEVDISCLFCKGNGCSICKKTGFVEMMGCGLVHPNVFKYCGLDPSKWQGYAFGLGLNRLCMLKYNINDIRLFLSGDLKFLEQF